MEYKHLEVYVSKGSTTLLNAVLSSGSGVGFTRFRHTQSVGETKLNETLSTIIFYNVANLTLNDFAN